MKPKISFLRASLIGAVFALVAGFLQDLSRNAIHTSIPYYGGGALGGALLGVGIAAFINRSRR